MTGKSFSVWLNNEYIPNHLDKSMDQRGLFKSGKEVH